MVDMDTTYSTRLTQPTALEVSFELALMKLKSDMKELGYPECTITMSITDSGSETQIKYK